MLRWRSGFQVLLIVALAILVVSVRSGTVAAQGPSGTPPVTNPSPLTVGHVHFLPPRGSAAAAAAVANTPAAGHTGGLFTTNNLVYHLGGPTMATAAAYAIFWEPTGGSSYESSTAAPADTTGDLSYQGKIEAYPTNLSLSPFLKILTEYPSSGNSTGNSTNFVSSWTDTSPYPPETRLLDVDIQNEVLKAITTNNLGWPTGGPSTEYFVFTPLYVNSCIDSTFSSCSFTQYCAYHGHFTDPANGQPVLYANMPDPGTDFSGCGPQSDPSGDQYADAAINLMSHEYAETITDPQLNAWFDNSGYEIGDKCAWNFGPTLGSTSSGAAYDLVLGPSDYMLQQEWSNGSSNCAMSYAVPGAPTNVTATPGNASATVSWNAPSSNGSTITGYTVTGYTATGNPGGTCTTTGALSCTVTSLTYGTVYTFTVTAANSVGTSSPSAPSNQVTPTAGPMVLSGSISKKPRGSVTVQAYVGPAVPPAPGTLCQGASVTLNGNSSSFSNLSIPASCGAQNSPVTLTVAGQLSSLSYGTPSQTCLSFNPSSSVSGITVTVGGTPIYTC